MLYVPQDELRILCFFTNIPGVYILLGQRPGAIVTSLAGALQLAETIREKIENLCPVIACGPLKITASIGIAECSKGDQGMKEIQQQADEAMYEAKKKGRNRVSSLSQVTPVLETALAG